MLYALYHFGTGGLPVARTAARQPAVVKVSALGSTYYSPLCSRDGSGRW